jgi:hypothetical protein
LRLIPPERANVAGPFGRCAPPAFAARGSSAVVGLGKPPGEGHHLRPRHLLTGEFGFSFDDVRLRRPPQIGILDALVRIIGLLIPTHLLASTSNPAGVMLARLSSIVNLAFTSSYPW